MARRRTAETASGTQTTEDTASTSATPMADPVDPATEFNPANFQAAQAVVQSVADAARLPDTEVSKATYSARRMQSVLTVPVGDLKVELVDKGDNRAGIGVRVVYPDGREPTNEEKDIIRENMKSPNGDFPSGFQWKPQMGLWHKEVGDVPGSRATAIRMDAERRVEKLAADLRQLHGIEYSHADRAEQSQGQGADPIPF